ncbi:MAG: cytochrome c [Hyphomicrobiales bacterium]|nr:cytochrome c [Hyphomicrobiales bacterium]
MQRARRDQRTGSGLVAALLLLIAGAASAQDALPVRNCTWCHGSSAQGFMFAPRLAGQRTAYIERELASFAAHARDNPLSQKYMWGAVARLDPATAQGLAVYFSSLAPEAAADGQSGLAATGKAIYDNGVAVDNVAACIACHGPNGEGVRDIPRLGGLSYVYLKRRLEQWNQGYHQSAKPMPLVAKSLSANEVEALASYLSFVQFVDVGR